MRKVSLSALIAVAMSSLSIEPLSAVNSGIGVKLALGRLIPLLAHRYLA